LLPQFVCHDTFDHRRITVLFDEELAHATLAGANLGEELLQVFDASAGKGRDGLVGPRDNNDHFAEVDVVRVSGDFFE